MRLPSSRELASEFGIARGTVVVAIDDLVAEGVLTARARAGVMIARQSARSDRRPAAGRVRPPEFDLRPGHPETGSFPTARWLAAQRRAASSGMSGAPDDAERAGAVELRTELAAYLARARGVETSADSIVVCPGFRGACTLLAAALRERAVSRVAIEDPSLPHVGAAWQLGGLQVQDLPVDDAGAQIDRLGSDVGAAVLTPSHQFPLGGALSAERRVAVCEWAARSDGFVVEDDYDGEFRFDRRPVAALQRSAPDRVIYVGSTSKTLSPRLRLGWLVVPAALVVSVTDAAERLLGGVPRLNQLALADLIHRGDYERHIRRQRREYARRRALLHAALRGTNVRIPGIPAGLHALIPCSPAVAAAAEDSERIAVHPLSSYSRSHDRPTALIAGFATPSRSRFEPALGALIDLLHGGSSTTSARR